MSPEQLGAMEEAAKANTTLAGLLSVDIQKRREQALRDRTSAYPRTHSILSDIGECDRQMVYSVTNWKDRPPVEPDLKARFEVGNVREREIIGELRALGHDVILQQEPVEIKNREGELIGRGKVDGHIKYHGIKIPIEIKSMHPAVWERIETLEDFHKKPYLRKYIRQLSMYLYGNNAEEGLFIMDDCLGHWKPIVVTLDFAEGEYILQRLERVQKHIKAGTQPDRIEFRDEICGQCPFQKICLPDVIRTEMQVLSDPDFMENLVQRERNAEARSAYERADKAAKDFIKKYGVTKGVAGEYVIVSKTSETKERVTPAGTMTRISITKLGQNVSAE